MAKVKSGNRKVKQKKRQVNQYDKILHEITERSEGYEREGAWRSSSDEVRKRHCQREFFQTQACATAADIIPIT
jgi:hypothetical protein